MSAFDLDPNWVRDAFWSSNLNDMFEKLPVSDESSGAEYVGRDFIVAKLTSEVLMVIKLPNNAEDMSEEELELWLRTKMGEM